MAAADCVGRRNRPSRHGRTLVGLLLSFAGGDPVRGHGRAANHETDDQRRGHEGRHGIVLHYWRAVSTDQLDGCRYAGVLAGGGRIHHADPGTSRLVGARRDKDIEHSNGARSRIGPRDQVYCDMLYSSERIAAKKSPVGGVELDCLNAALPNVRARRSDRRTEHLQFRR